MRRFGSAAEFLMLVVVAASSNAAWGQTAKPTVAAATNVASYANGSISPGEMVVIFGSGMGPSSVVGFQLDQQGRVANTLSQVQVLFDGNPAPLIYVSATQISAMVPYGLAGKSSTQIQVVYQGEHVRLVSETDCSVSAGNLHGRFFRPRSSGDDEFGRLLQHGMRSGRSRLIRYVLPDRRRANRPTRFGRQRRSFHGKRSASGHGSDCGSHGATPLRRISARKRQRLRQINAVIPADMQYGGNLPLVVQIGGVSSQTGVTLAVSGPPAPIPGAPQNPTASVNSSRLRSSDMDASGFTCDTVSY